MAAMSDESRALRLGSPERFGYSWDRFAALTADREEQLRRRTALLPPSEWKGARFLDVGCGMGRSGRTEYARLIRSFSYRHLRHIVFDQLLPRIARYYRKSEALELLHQAGLQNVSALWVNEMSWCVMGDKQAKAS
jgi:SAM-dependent methyltransferase